MLYFLYGVVVIDFVVERSPLFISSSPFFFLVLEISFKPHNSYKKNLLSMK